MLQISQVDLKAHFSADVIGRGQKYQRQGRVLFAEILPSENDDDAFIDATVEGNDVYNVSIQVHGLRTGHVAIAGHCSCPVMHNCKHVVAAILEVCDITLSGRKGEAPVVAPRGDDVLQRWLHKFTLQPTNRASGKDDRAVIYIARVDLDAQGALVTVDLVTARKESNGHYAPQSPMTLERILNASRAAYVAESDVEIAAKFVALFGGPRSQTAFPLVDERGGRLWRDIISTGRCFWLNSYEPPLRLADDRAAEIRWQVEVNGYQRLRFFTEPAADEALPFSPPWFVDRRTHQTGTIRTQLADEKAALLAVAPRVPPTQARAWREAMRKQGGDVFTDALLPQDIRLERIQSVACVPVLTLGKILADHRDRWLYRIDAIGTARLVFKYGDRLVAWDEPEQDVIEYADGVASVVERNRMAEDRYVVQLRSLGLRQVAEVPGLIVDRKYERLWSGWAPQGESEFWYRFLAEALPILRMAGWQIEIDSDFPYQIIESDDWYVDLETTGIDWFGLELGVELDGEKLNLIPVITRALQDPHFSPELPLMVALPDGRRLRLEGERVRQFVDTVVELYDPSLVNRGGQLRLARTQALRMLDLQQSNDSKMRWGGVEGLKVIGDKLRAGVTPQPVALPDSFKATLRPYQQEGVNWLQFLREVEMGGVLADDMGLGKTIQTLATLCIEKQSGRANLPSLLIIPTSLVANWVREAKQFAPEIAVLVLHGTQRRTAFKEILDHDLVITTYPLLARDYKALAQHEYHYLILDEAQAIKNSRTQVAQIVQALKARHRLCLTGTPMENHLGELWSQFQFLIPGLLGDERMFRKLFRTPVEKQGDQDRLAALQRRIRPFLLRRTKDAVAADLPPRNDILRTLEFSSQQRDLYESIRIAMHERVRDEISRKGVARSQIIILDALLKLRQVCCDPRLLKLTSAKRVNESAKLELLKEMLQELVAEGRRILVFSQFTSMLALIEEALQDSALEYVTLTGQTKDRVTPINRFQNQEVPLFLISLKAGGVGLNLTAADTVIHYDPWWNPAVERQATDRAHRIGQTKTVFNYKLIVAGSVEEKILELQDRKRALIEGLLGDAKRGMEKVTEDDIEYLFAPM